MLLQRKNPTPNKYKPPTAAAGSVTTSAPVAGLIVARAPKRVLIVGDNRAVDFEITTGFDLIG